MATVIATPLTVASADKFPVVPIANGIVPDEALAVTINLQFSPSVQAILVDLSESARKFNTIPIQGAFIDTSGSAIDLRIDNSVTGQSVLAKAGLQGYYNLLCPMPAKLIAVLASAPGAQLNITMILYNTVIESEVWGLTSGPAGPTGPQGPPGATGATGPQGPAGTITPATATVLGGVKIGANVTVQADGTISVAAPYTLPIATSTVLGGVKAGTGVSIAGDGTLSAPVLAPATNTVLGGVKVGTNVSVLPDGTISVPITTAFQTPWLSNIAGGGFALNSAGAINNVGAIGIGTASVAATPLAISTAANAPTVSVTSSNSSGGAMQLFTNDSNVQMMIGVGGSLRGVTQEQNNGFLNIPGSGNLIFETQSIEQMRLTQVGWLGIGNPIPVGNLEIKLPAGRLSNSMTPGTNTGVGFALTGNGAFGLYGGISGSGAPWLQAGRTDTATVFPLNLQTAGGNVAIGTTAAAATLHVKGPALGAVQGNTISLLTLENTNNNNSQLQILQIRQAAGNDWTSSTTRIRAVVDASQQSWLDFNPTGGPLGSVALGEGPNEIIRFAFSTLPQVGIGVASPAHMLQLVADDAAKPGTSTWTIASGAAVKRKVKRLVGGLDIINRLNPTEAEYNGRGGTPEGQRVVSLIAEEVREILPHTVTEDKDGNLGFNIHEVIHHLILSVQQLTKKLEKLEAAA